MLEKYGVEHALQSKIFKDKSKQTCLERYGVQYSFQSNNNKNKSKQTCLEKYGVNIANQFSTEELWNEYRKNMLIKYGVDHPVKCDIVKKHIKNSWLRKYGVDHIWKSEAIRNKIKNTLLERYGVNHQMKCESIINKIIETKFQNNSFGKSNEEDELYLFIKAKFPNVIRQYKDKNRYPFCCDFYIPELDYFIEYNGFWTHGKHPYDENNIEDKNIITKWIMLFNNGEHPLYKKAIYGWTVSDVNKRNIAHQNNLNYYEFYNLEEAKKFIRNL